MNKAAALALMNALEGQKVPGNALMRWDGTGAEVWTVEIDPDYVLSGVQLGLLTQYVAGAGLTLSATFSQLGIS